MLLKKSFQLIFRFSVLIYTLLLISSCNRNPEQADVSGIRLEVAANRLEQDLFSTKVEDISFLKNRYGSFFDLFCFKLTETGAADTQLLKNHLRNFTSDADLVEIYSSSEKIFHDFTPFNQEFTTAFKHYHYYFPQKIIPRVITFISGFNYAVVAADSALGIGLDMYLGSDSKYYPALQFPRYKIVRMRKEYLAADAMRGWAQSEWEQDAQQSDLLSQMIYEGKILYFLNSMLPDVADTIKTGYTLAQLNWCGANEKNTWSFFVDQKILFSADQGQLAKFMNDGPTTNGFPKESPGAIGQWLGWKIVQAYMKKKSTVSLEQLMNTNDYKKILLESKYKPAR